MATRMKVLCKDRHATLVRGLDSEGREITGEVVHESCFRSYTFEAVMAPKSDPDHENHTFWKYTPILNFSTTITNPAVDFEVGAEYNIEISKANTRTNSSISSTTKNRSK